MAMLIKGAKMVDPGNRGFTEKDKPVDIRIEGGKIVAVTESVSQPRFGSPDTAPEDVIDASGKIVVPGLIDMHVHFREPGHEYKETIESGCRAAATGGFTAVCTMPNTNPVNDNGQVTSFILEKARKACGVRVYPIAAISRGQKGEKLCEFGELKHAGAIAVSDDGKPVRDPLFMRKAMEYARGFGLPVISHCEEPALSAGGSMNEGPVSTRLGLQGIPNVAESIMVLRDIALCELTGSSLHIAHVSARESVRAIREAKKRGVPVTAETAPHYFTLTDDYVDGYNTHAKMNPPLRSEADREAIREGLSDGTIDVIATDHAPHSALEKDLEFDRAAFGIVGLETALSVSLKLVWDDILDLETLIGKMTVNPAKILGLEKKGLVYGAPADLTLIDPNKPNRVMPEQFLSLSRNTPFENREFRGKAVMTIVNGNVLHDELTKPTT